MTPNEVEEQLIRNFSENSVKFLMHNKANVREGMWLIAPKHANLIDFDQMIVEKTSFIAGWSATG